MFMAQYGMPSAYYGNIKYGLYTQPSYKWGAWDLEDHWPEPLTEKEIKAIEVHTGQIPEVYSKPEIKPVTFDLEAETKRILQHMGSVTYKPYAIAKKATVRDRDDEDYFILM
jgi:hypothetical protein